VRFSALAGLDIVSLANVLPEGTEVQETVPGHYLVTGTVDPRLLADVTAWCADRHVMPEDLAIDRRTLEDVFIDLTGHELRT
jgi:ABC-2 type transport system ATP-binding protein